MARKPSPATTLPPATPKTTECQSYPCILLRTGPAAVRGIAYEFVTVRSLEESRAYRLMAAGKVYVVNGPATFEALPQDFLHALYLAACRALSAAPAYHEATDGDAAGRAQMIVNALPRMSTLYTAPTPTPLGAKNMANAATKNAAQKKNGTKPATTPAPTQETDSLTAGLDTKVIADEPANINDAVTAATETPAEKKAREKAARDEAKAEQKAADKARREAAESERKKGNAERATARKAEREQKAAERKAEREAKQSKTQEERDAEKAAKVAAKAAEKLKNPGVIGTIKALLEGGVTVQEAVDELVRKFPDRDADGMKTTVRIQFNRLATSTGREIANVVAEGRGRVYAFADQNVLPEPAAKAEPAPKPVKVSKKDAKAAAAASAETENVTAVADEPVTA